MKKSKKYRLLADKLDCPYCKYPYGEEEMEAKIWHLFKCDRCEKKIRVALIKGRIILQKRLERMNYFNLMLKERQDHKYMQDYVLKESIVHGAKGYNKELRELFFKSGKTLWVRKSRAMFFEMCNTVGIPNKNIISFFKLNDGKIDNRTINSYING